MAAVTDEVVFNNFDLHIERGDRESYPLSILYSPAGETPEPVRVRISRQDEQLSGWLAELKAGTLRGEELVGLGRRLTSYLMPPGRIRDLYQRSLGLTEARDMRLRIRLRISPPEVAALPWEYAYDDDIGDFFALNPRTVLVRYHGQPIRHRPIDSFTPLTILLLIANPSIPGVSSLAAATEVRNVLEALDRLLSDGLAHVDILFSGPVSERHALEELAANHAEIGLLPDGATIDSLRTSLRQGYRMVHYIGHGGFDSVDGGVLLMATEEGLEAPVRAQTLARELRSSSTAVVVLNACESAVDGTGQSFMGVAPSLIRAGVPAVVAMQYAIRDTSALHFSRALYEALTIGWPLDAAVTEGRKAIDAHLPMGESDWGIPVLFMRSPDGVIWQAERTPARTQANAPDGIGQTGGGVHFHDKVQIAGDVVTGPKYVYGDEIHGVGSEKGSGKTSRA